MSDAVRIFNHNCILTIVLVSLLPLAVFSIQEAFAHGEAPSTCPNRYDSTITQMTLNNGTHTFDPLENPNLTFRADINSGFYQSMTLHTANNSSNGNQDVGSTWYRHFVYGYAQGICVDDVGPNEDAIVERDISWNVGGWGPYASSRTYPWGTTQNSVTYKVDWYGQWNNSPTQPFDDIAETRKNTPVTIDVLANDIDPDGDEIIISKVQSPRNGNGTAVINSDNTITYTPNQDFVGTDSFYYYAYDGKQDSDWAKVTVNVINSPPRAVDDSTQTNINESATIDVLANDSDPDGDPLSVNSIMMEPMHGTVTINPDNTITYTPDFAFVGSDSFDYQISDGNGGTDTAMVSITVNVIEIPALPSLPL